MQTNQKAQHPSTKPLHSRHKSPAVWKMFRLEERARIVDKRRAFVSK